MGPALWRAPPHPSLPAQQDGDLPRVGQRQDAARHRLPRRTRQVPRRLHVPPGRGHAKPDPIALNKMGKPPNGFQVFVFLGLCDGVRGNMKVSQ